MSQTSNGWLAWVFVLLLILLVAAAKHEIQQTKIADAVSAALADPDKQPELPNEMRETPADTRQSRSSLPVSATSSSDTQPSALGIDNPISLMGDEIYKYMPSRSSLLAWLATVPALADIDSDAIDYTPELAELWKECCSHMALRAFVSSYQRRETGRWESLIASVSLATELAPVLPFMDRHFGEDDKLWDLIRSYDEEVQTTIRRSAHDDVGAEDDEKAKWPLNRILRAAASRSIDTMVQTLREK